MLVLHAIHAEQLLIVDYSVLSTSGKHLIELIKWLWSNYISPHKASLSQLHGTTTKRKLYIKIANIE